MKQKIKYVMLLLTIVLLVSVIAETPIYALDTLKNAGIESSSELTMIDVEEDIENDITDYMLAVAQEKLYGNVTDAKDLRGSAAESLSGNELIIYDTIRTRIVDIASGNSNDTEIIIPFTSLTYSKHSFTAEELGVDTIWLDNAKTVPNEEAETALRELTTANIADVIDMLFEDIPYYLYWCNGYGYVGELANVSYNGETISFDPDESYVSIFLTADTKYSTDEYGAEIDSSKIRIAAKSAENAAAIVKANASKADIEKLYAYKNTIEELVDYDDEAVINPVDNDPWNIVNVFDNNPSTKAVCEGYAKAFKFLCDLSTFNSKAIKVITVGGDLDGTGHMWNIIRMDDGKNYLADITLSDDLRSYNNNEATDVLFLVGTSKGSVQNGYEFRADDYDTFLYEYDESTKNIYGSKYLTLSQYPYGGSATKHVHRWYLDYTTYHPLTKVIQNYVYSCTGCTEKKTVKASNINIKVGIKKPASAKKAITVKWKKVSAVDQQNISGLQIQIATNKKFKNAKTYKVGKALASKKIKKLKSKKTYYVRIRAYRKDGNMIHVSKWSAVKKIKTK